MRPHANMERKETLQTGISSWERGFCPNVSNNVLAEYVRIPSRGACVLLCLLHPQCRFVGFGTNLEMPGGRHQCRVSSSCPLPLHHMPDKHTERQYTVDLRRKSRLCAEAEAAVDAETHALLEQRDPDLASEAVRRFTKQASIGLCEVTARDAGRMTRQNPSTCERASAGIFTLTTSEASSWGRATRACLNRCATCRKCNFITVAPSHGHCAWHHRCTRASVRVNPWRNESQGSACGFRSGPSVPGPVRAAALVLFGKIGSDSPIGSRSSRAGADEKASEHIIRMSTRLWVAHLMEPNPDVRFDVFVHTWSPEAAPLVTKLWGLLLVGQQHEPTRFMDTSSPLLAFHCAVPSAINCERTASQLLTMSKALALKREHELASGETYGFVVVARFDSSLTAPYTVPAALWKSKNDEVWFIPNCTPGCKVSEGSSFVVPDGCLVTGRLCIERVGAMKRGTGRFGQRLSKDYVFAGSSPAVDLMGDAHRHFADYTRDMMRDDDEYIATHYIWPWHAIRSKLRLRWELRVALKLTREIDAAWMNASFGDASPTESMSRRVEERGRPERSCSVPVPSGHGLELTGRVDASLVRAEFRHQCPHEQALICGSLHNYTQAHGGCEV